MLILIVAGGPDKGRIYELLDDRPVVLGREGDPVRLSDRKASRKHARLWAEGGQWYVRDLGSRHGTHVNADRIEGQHELADGDHIQLGSTLFVVARMAVEQAERMALLGDDEGRGAATKPLPLPSASGRGRLVAGGAALAAAVLIGSNTMIYLSSRTQVDELRGEIARSNQAVLEEVRSRTVLGDNGHAPQDELLQEILATVTHSSKTAREQEKLLNQIGEAIAVQPDSATLFETILSRLDEAPKQTQMLAAVLNKVSQPAAPAEPDPATTALLAEVKAMARESRTQQLALAEKADKTEALLRETLAQVKDQPTVERLAAAVRSEVKAEADGNAALLEKVLANLDEQRALASQLAELRGLIESQPAATVTAVREIVESMGTPGEPQDDEAVLAAIEQVRQALPENLAGKLDRVLAKLDSDAAPQQLAAAMKTLLDERETASASALAELKARLDAQPTREDLTTALEQALAEPDAALLARLDALTADGEQHAQTRETLAAVLAEVRNREPIQQLRDDLSKLAELQAAQAPTAMLGEILAAVRDERDADARLTEIHTLLKAWPAQTETMLKQMLAAVRDQDQPGSDALDELLGDIRSRAIARIDELDAAIRADLQAELASGQASPQPRDGRTAGPRGSRSRSVLTSTPDDAAQEPVLTRTEQAYQLAFETGQPVTIGGGVINASTGQISEGRTLDPAAARAAGIKHWREWYLMDDFAERMRLQKQALRYAGDADHSPVISLPPASSPPIIVNASPDPAGR